MLDLKGDPFLQIAEDLVLSHGGAALRFAHIAPGGPAPPPERAGRVPEPHPGRARVPNRSAIPSDLRRTHRRESSPPAWTPQRKRHGPGRQGGQNGLRPLPVVGSSRLDGRGLHDLARRVRLHNRSARGSRAAGLRRAVPEHSPLRPRDDLQHHLKLPARPASTTGQGPTRCCRVGSWRHACGSSNRPSIVRVRVRLQATANRQPKVGSSSPRRNSVAASDGSCSTALGARGLDPQGSAVVLGHLPGGGDSWLRSSCEGRRRCGCPESDAAAGRACAGQGRCPTSAAPGGPRRPGPRGNGVQPELGSQRPGAQVKGSGVTVTDVPVRGSYLSLR